MTGVAAHRAVKKANGLAGGAENKTITRSRHRIVTLSTPGVAAANSLDCQPSSPEGSVFSNSNQGIFRTGGQVAAGGRRKRRNANAIQPNRYLGNKDCDSLPTGFACFFHSLSSFLCLNLNMRPNVRQNPWFNKHLGISITELFFKAICHISTARNAYWVDYPVFFLFFYQEILLE
jgi:hypothetical protein